MNTKLNTEKWERETLKDEDGQKTRVLFLPHYALREMLDDKDLLKGVYRLSKCFHFSNTGVSNLMEHDLLTEGIQDGEEYVIEI